MIFVYYCTVQCNGERFKFLAFSIVQEKLLLHEEPDEGMAAHWDELLPGKNTAPLALDAVKYM